MTLLHEKVFSAKNLHNGLNRINNWAFQWKMSFNPDPNKQAQEVIFSHKIKKSAQPPLIFGNSIVIQLITQLRMFLDTKLDFFKDGYFKGSEFIGC